MSSEKEYSEKVVRSLAELISAPLLLPLSAGEIVLKAAAKGNSKAIEHLINAQIETLNSAKAVVENRIEKLQKLKDDLISSSVKKVKEKVSVE